LRDIGDIATTLEDAASQWQGSALRAENAKAGRTKATVDPTSVSKPAVTPIRALVVLPFENLSSDPEQEYFVEGMTDALSAELGRVRALRVISRTSAMRYKDADKNVKEIATELGVDAVIEGSVLKVGSDVRITVHLVDSRIDTHLWSKNYTGTLTNILALQSEVALAVVREIEIALTPEEERRIAHRKPVKPDAYEAYLKGIFFMERHTEEGFRTAAMHFNRAIQIEPDFAEAHAWLGGAYWVPTIWGYAAPHESFRKAKVAMSTAVELDETCAEAVGGVGWIALYYDWDWKKAKESLEKAVTLNRNYSYGYHGLAWYWVAAGHFDTAIDTIQKAIELDPLSHVLNGSLASIYRHAERDREAIEQRRRTLELVPGFVTTLADQAEHYLSRSMHGEAIESIRKAMEVAGNTPRLVAMLAGAYAVSGKGRQAETLLRELQECEKSRYVSPMCFAGLYTSLGNPDEAFRWLDKAYEKHDPAMLFLRVASSLEPLRCDERFDKLLEQMNFPE
jgi:TolB-like protein/Flp pilus assembly protein TadD